MSNEIPDENDMVFTHEQEKAVRLNLLIDLLTLVPVVAVAVLANSMLLMSDIFEYAKSITTSLIAWYILRRMRQGDIGGYDYGLGKMEALGGLTASSVMLAGIFAMMIATSWRMLQPEAVDARFATVGLLIQAGGLGVNTWLWRRNRKLSQRAYSHLIDAQWRTNRADAIANLGVIMGLSLTLFLGGRYEWSVYIDPICALLALLASTSGFAVLLRSCLQDLLDKTLDEHLQIKVLKHLTDNYDGYESFHGVRSRRAGRKVFVEISLGFHPDKTMGEVMDTVSHLTESTESDIPGSEVRVILAKPDCFPKNISNWNLTKILPLSATTLEPAMALIGESFSLTAEEVPQLELEESVTPGRHALRLAEHGMSDPAYWVALYHGRVVGLTGYYYKPEDRHEAVWGGWTVCDPKIKASASRAKMMMLQKTVIEARATGRKYLRLYTTTVPAEAQANHLYDRIGMKVYRSEPMPDGKNLVLYRQGELAALYSRLAAIGK